MFYFDDLFTGSASSIPYSFLLGVISELNRQPAFQPSVAQRRKTVCALDSKPSECSLTHTDIHTHRGRSYRSVSFQNTRAHVRVVVGSTWSPVRSRTMTKKKCLIKINEKQLYVGCRSIHKQSLSVPTRVARISSSDASTMTTTHSQTDQSDLPHTSTHHRSILSPERGRLSTLSLSQSNVKMKSNMWFKTEKSLPKKKRFNQLVVYVRSHSRCLILVSSSCIRTLCVRKYMRLLRICCFSPLFLSFFLFFHFLFISGS